MMKDTDAHNELLHAVAETLTAAQELVTSLGNLRDATEADKETGPLSGTSSETGAVGEGSELTGSDRVEQVCPPRYKHHVMILASEESVNHLVEQESVAHPADAIVAIEFEVGSETPAQVLLVMDAILSEFPELNRLVVDMQVMGDSLKDLLQLMSSKCPCVTSFSFKHLLSRA
jgi:hypothetical protein